MFSSKTCRKLRIYAKHVKSDRKSIKEDEYQKMGFKNEKFKMHNCGCSNCKFVL